MRISNGNNNKRNTQFHYLFIYFAPENWFGPCYCKWRWCFYFSFIFEQIIYILVSLHRICCVCVCVLFRRYFFFVVFDCQWQKRRTVQNYMFAVVRSHESHFERRRKHVYIWQMDGSSFGIVSFTLSVNFWCWLLAVRRHLKIWF